MTCDALRAPAASGGASAGCAASTPAVTGGAAWQATSSTDASSGHGAHVKERRRIYAARGRAASAIRNVYATPNATVIPMERTKGTDEKPSSPNDISVVVIDRNTASTAWWLRPS